MHNKTTPIPFEEFEKAVMTKLLEKDTPLNELLRKQYSNAIVTERSFTGVGFFTDFQLPPQTERIAQPSSFECDSICATINGISEFSFVLFIRGGIITMLEGYTFGSRLWPETIYSYELVPNEKYQVSE